jgi:phosphoserine/homoserine phosphotransferase
MQFRLGLLAKNKLKITDIQRVFSGMDPLPGVVEFTQALRERTQVVILSDTFEQFAKPLMEKLAWPCLFCNSLETSSDGTVTGYRLRQKNGKKEAVRAFKSINVSVFAAGDSFNDLAMIHEADAGCLFRAPESIKNEYSQIPCVDTYNDLLGQIERFLATPIPNS